MFIQYLDNDDIRLVTSASDLTAASMCEFAFARRVDKKLGRDVVVPDNEDAMLKRTALLGDQHEARVLAEYEAQFVDARAVDRCGVWRIDRPETLTVEQLLLAQQHTLAAFNSGADVVFQATFFDPEQVSSTDEHPAIGFLGFADFIVRTAHGNYQVQDTKLARRAKVTALMQLAAYAEQLRRLGVDCDPDAALILGDGQVSTHALSDIEPVFRLRRERLHQLLWQRAALRGSDGSRASAAAVQWGDPTVNACGRCEVCEPEVQAHRDPLLIAGITTHARNALIASGLGTIDLIADASDRICEGRMSVPTISKTVLCKIATQARMQVSAQPGEVVPFFVADASALKAIPPASEGDLFFDFEGDPLYREGGATADSKWGIDYLFGMVDNAEQFTAFWAHTLDEEREALIAFLNFVTARRARYPDMKIYHYASYERTHLLSIAGRHGVGEKEVDQLLRDNVLVDLYPIVRATLRVGSRSYSIKKLEPLYMGNELRAEDGVTTAAESVTEYALAAQLRLSEQPHEREESQRILEQIADYNRYDCVSTRRLRNWLRELADAEGVQPEIIDKSSAEKRDEIELSETARQLKELSKTASDQPMRQALALAASAIDYYERERKSFWWAHFDRLVAPVEDWANTRDVVVVDASLSVAEAWVEPTGRARNERRRLHLRGSIAPGTSYKPDSEVHLVYEPPVGFDFVPSAPGARAARKATVVEQRDDVLIVEESRNPSIDAWHDLPIAVTPGGPPPAGKQKEAIEEWGRAIANTVSLGGEPRDAAFDVLLRKQPRLDTHAALVDPTSAEAVLNARDDDSLEVGAIVASLRDMRASTLAVQGPPGTGKTYLAARVIRNLVLEHNWRIGVVAQSHAVVENVLKGIVDAGLPAEQVGKVPQKGSSPEDSEKVTFTVLSQDGHKAFTEAHRERDEGCVVGGTAWDFSNTVRFDRHSLDLIVIDEAGQFSLAPTIAVSVAAERLLLLGDPQQLPQVSQGTHPEPVDTSALGWLIAEHDTLPSELGYFLAETRRMRPELAEHVSQLSYDGLLHAHPSTLDRVLTNGGQPGLTWHPVRHTGNSTFSPEEAAKVVEITQLLLGATLTLGDQTPRSLTAKDVIVIAPYNAQVQEIERQLAAAGLEYVRVGTVDKFQGQEAVVAIVSLTASSAEDAPRGLEFVLLRNRINVAISRGQWAAHVVSSPTLGDSLPASVASLTSLSAYLRLIESAYTEGNE